MVMFCLLRAVNIERLFMPESITVIGASKTEGKIGNQAMANGIEYNGRISHVNLSKSGTVFEEQFVESVTDIDDVIDLVLRSVPAPVVPDVLLDWEVN